MSTEKIYVIDDGETFEGTLEQFQNCFFSNADEEMIKYWCEHNGLGNNGSSLKMKLEIR